MIPDVILATLLLVVIGGAIYLIFYINKQDKIRKIKEEKLIEEKNIWKQQELKKLEEEERKEIEECIKQQKETILEYDLKFGIENSIECSVVGIFARSDKAKVEARSLKPGEIVNLIPEPNNSYDRSAVKVVSNRLHIGYIPSEVSDEVFNTIKNGKGYHAIVTYKRKYFNNVYFNWETLLELKLYPITKENRIKKEKVANSEPKSPLTYEQKIEKLDKKYYTIKYYSVKELIENKLRLEHNIWRIKSEIDKGDKTHLDKKRKSSLRMKEELMLIKYYIDLKS